MGFDVVAAFCQAPETELIFIKAPEEHRAVVGQHVLWQCLKVRQGRRTKEQELGKIISLKHCCREIAQDLSNRV